ncbi:MAG: Unknown protein [uncultured Sulfurovum sp.]|uniref:Uncharacterized protein n=1 Tax=uncultured Sulfurovum sp. TaxID=269237 RepID=A0A6S6SN86_9BACT|nr:MAG: Unknown protein [uncultured Sulfurovum sp.]
MFENLNDNELDALLKYKSDGKIDDETLNGLSDAALDAMLSLKKKKSSVPTTLAADNIDHSIVPDVNDNTPPKEKSLWEKVKKTATKLGEEILQPLAIGAENIATVISPVDVDLTDAPTLKDDINKVFTPEDDVTFDTYQKIGMLSKTASGLNSIGIGEAKKEDVETYNNNLTHLLVDKMGYKDVLFDDDNGKYYVETADGKQVQLNKDWVKTMSADIFADKAEIIGAMVGAKKGFDATKVGGTKGKIVGSLVGGALGAGLGNIGDQFMSAIETGEKLTMAQRLREVNKAAALDVAGGVVAGTVISVGGKALSLPADVSKKVYNHIINGNIDGAKKILKSDFGVDDAYIDDALAQMNAAQKEAYGKERNIIDDAVTTAKSGDLKGALTQVSDGALDTLGNAQAKEEMLATAMSHPQGAGVIKDALAGNVKGALELEKSIDGRAKQVLNSVDGITGTKAKEAVGNYEQRVQKQYSDMRNTFNDAFKETDYRFELDDLGLEKVLGDLEQRVADPFAKERFNGMSKAVENIIEKSNDGLGVEKNIDALLDVRQMMNKFYRKNKTAFELKPDKDAFRALIKGIDNEVENAMSNNLTPEISKELLGYFDDARGAYKEMYDVQDSGIYKALMGNDKSSDDRLKGLLNHAKDDGKELQALLKNLGSEERTQMEETLVSAVLDKFTKGSNSELQVIDYAKAIDEFTALKPFVENDGAKRSMDLVEDIYKKYRHDYDLSKSVKSVSEMVNAGGIGSSVQGRLEVATTSKVFRYVMTLIPFGETPKRLALQRHIGSALKKSRTPVDLAKRLSADNTIDMKSRTHLKELIKVHNQVLKADNVAKQEQAAKEFDEIQERIAKEQELKAREVVDFVVPDITELRAVQKLHGDDTTATLARTIRTLQEGKGTTADIERYLKAKEKVANRLPKQLEKEQINLFPAKYRNVGTKEIDELKSLRDYLMSHNDLKFGNEIQPQKFKALLFDLERNGVPRSVEYDGLYDELRAMHEQLKPEINKAYGSPLDDVSPDDVF